MSFGSRQASAWRGSFHFIPLTAMPTQEALNEILTALGRIEGRMEEFSTHPDRIRKLEARSAWLTGALAVVAFVVGAALKMVGHG